MNDTQLLQGDGGQLPNGDIYNRSGEASGGMTSVNSPGSRGSAGGSVAAQEIAHSLAPRLAEWPLCWFGQCAEVVLTAVPTAAPWPCE